MGNLDVLVGIILFVVAIFPITLFYYAPSALLENTAHDAAKAASQTTGQQQQSACNGQIAALKKSYGDRIAAINQGDNSQLEVLKKSCDDQVAAINQRDSSQLDNANRRLSDYRAKVNNVVDAIERTGYPAHPEKVALCQDISNKISIQRKLDQEDPKRMIPYVPDLRTLKGINDELSRTIKDDREQLESLRSPSPAVLPFPPLPFPP